MELVNSYLKGFFHGRFPTFYKLIEKKIGKIKVLTTVTVQSNTNNRNYLRSL